MSHSLFGTDGVRGKPGAFPLDEQTVMRLGAALIRVVPHQTARKKVLVARDTRESGAWIERQLACGIHSEGGSLTSAGVLPTPAVAYLTSAKGFDVGVVISASHNPFSDNGIKIFTSAGQKASKSLELRIETDVDNQILQATDTIPSGLETVDLERFYTEHVIRAFPNPSRLGRLKMAIDCANGATAAIAPRIFHKLGFNVVALHCTPDGKNINQACGSTHLEDLIDTVVKQGCQLGVAYDGDGDRVIFIDHRGKIVDGDAVLFICAKQLHATGRLRGNTVVATVMSNLGLELAFRDLGIDLLRCQVGDRYVMEEMIKRDLSLGGEQSGHIIFSDHLFTGDGILTTLSVLHTMAETKRKLADLVSDLRTYPQVLLNVPVRHRKDLQSIPEVATAIANVEKKLAKQGRLLVRYSGTESLLRVMVEGPDQATIHLWADEIAKIVRRHLG